MQVGFQIESFAFRRALLSTFSLWCVPGAQTQAVFAECSKHTVKLAEICLRIGGDSFLSEC